jgi:glutamyl-tRNA(Gln) amidotransferase subunit E
LLIFEKISRKECSSVKEAIDSLNLKKITFDELQKIMDKIIDDNISIIRQKGVNSISTLMGKSMALLRGKADGYTINNYLVEKIKHLVDEGNKPSSSF